MNSASEQILLRVYLQSADRAPHVPTYSQLIEAARREKLAGATAIRAIMGVGYHGILKPPGVFSFVEHVPIIVEIVDSAEKIAAFLRGPMDALMIGGMATLERAAVLMVRNGKSAPASGLADVAAALHPLSTVPKIEPGSHMKINENGILLRVFIGESDRWQHQPLYEAIVQKVRELGLAGATVLRGSEGFGANSVVHKSRLLEMSSDLPIVIEVVDSEENIRKLQPHLEEMVLEGMITMEYVMILMYRHNRADAPSDNS
jgi:uncharacterized protein